MQSRTAQGPGISRNSGGNAQEESGGSGETGGGIKKTVAGAARCVGNAFRWLGGKCRAFMGMIRKPFIKKAEEDGGEIQETMTGKEGAGSVTKTVGRAWRMTGRGIAVLWRGLAEFCIFWLKFMWNAAWLIFALICAGMAMITLLGAGVIAVFLVQGYPFIGFFLMDIGGLLCFGSLAYGSFGLLIRRKKKGGDDSRREAAGDVDETESDCDNRQEEMIQKYGKEAAYGQTT